jgi:hypothetical protein
MMMLGAAEEEEEEEGDHTPYVVGMGGGGGRAPERENETGADEVEDWMQTVVDTDDQALVIVEEEEAEEADDMSSAMEEEEEETQGPARKYATAMEAEKECGDGCRTWPCIVARGALYVAACVATFGHGGWSAAPLVALHIDCRWEYSSGRRRTPASDSSARRRREGYTTGTVEGTTVATALVGGALCGLSFGSGYEGGGVRTAVAVLLAVVWAGIGALSIVCGDLLPRYSADDTIGTSGGTASAMLMMMRRARRKGNWNARLVMRLLGPSNMRQCAGGACCLGILLLTTATSAEQTAAAAADEREEDEKRRVRAQTLLVCARSAVYTGLLLGERLLRVYGRTSCNPQADDHARPAVCAAARMRIGRYGAALFAPCIAALVLSAGCLWWAIGYRLTRRVGAGGSGHNLAWSEIPYALVRVFLHDGLLSSRGEHARMVGGDDDRSERAKETQESRPNARSAPGAGAEGLTIPQSFQQKASAVHQALAAAAHPSAETAKRRLFLASSAAYGVGTNATITADGSIAQLMRLASSAAPPPPPFLLQRANAAGGGGPVYAGGGGDTVVSGSAVRGSGVDALDVMDALRLAKAQYMCAKNV